ncbi:pyridoxamine 5'-phosphate oxidase-like FMN-binding protein [Halosimplex carlsbadense 2-9-1]|uniref:Pyridoxamine 5'-phosphate oxidase-like FMN-binding protein n=1 Tax=Halosimplex carlsbadense 2-9-1 TaxID=797114 RepID=M0D361_9EURY|nr:pyridoxamine 5'-phosphate oxidase family protein [Halosimplex carlsbadense]ELZ29122.1 pyridoxamine 5'-phosphate oxidase-like FMN-binding protein [Halosimplex carlsbadense 2-9-1]
MAQPVPDEVETLLTGAPVAAHLATCADGRPHAAPVWFRYEPADGDDRPVIEVMTTGRKLANVRENPRVALSIQESDAGHPEWTVTVRGTATVVEDAAVTERANRRINERYGADPDDWSDNTLVRIAVGSASHRTY